jgi:septal ring factor EnvC (AmiA/AmiB activator)
MIFLFLGLSLGTGLSTEPQEAQEQLSRSLKKEIAVQKELDQWSQEKQSLVNDLLDLKTQLKWTQYQNDKYRSYIQQEKEVLADLDRKERELKTLRMELEPFLAQVVETLKQCVAHDLPFLLEEREKRITFLQTSLTEKGIDLHERLRRVFEALQVEAGYGNSVEVTERRLNLQGEVRQAQVLRLGRLNLYYRTLDGQEVGHWDVTNSGWQPLPRKYTQQIKKTIEIAQQKRAAELVDLPVGMVKEKETPEKRLEQ